MARGPRGVIYFKYADFKKAIVTFEDSFKDVGKGLRIPEIDDIDDNTHEETA